jgi:hypothetical protein
VAVFAGVRELAALWLLHIGARSSRMTRLSLHNGI